MKVIPMGLNLKDAIANLPPLPRPPDRRGCLTGAAGLLLSTTVSSASRADTGQHQDPERRAAIHPSLEARRFQTVPGETMAVRVPSGAIAGAFTVLESTIAPGGAAPMHFHTAADETFLILSGTLRIVCGGAAIDAEPGDSVTIPRGAHHGFINLGSTDAHTLAIFNPGGIEDMFAQISTTPKDQWPALAARYDTVITGPPPSP